MARMRRIQVLLDPDLDDRLEREAAARGISKSALVRESVERQLGTEPFNNGLTRLTGLFEGRPDDSASIDEVVYEWGY
ncbi:MAG TPA: ribbon-helix-helix protein, CopG family [Gaiellaceae bacterium]|nr:ribbon-helix-helix protein, CopG family [Gaiellaceae bacterium]